MAKGGGQIHKTKFKEAAIAAAVKEVKPMADYLSMYRVLFNAITDGCRILQDAQLATEEAYISAEEPAIQFVEEE